MKALDRRNKILAQLEEQHTVYITDLAQQLNVSAMTIRRDLSNFSEQGLVTIVHGGAVLNRGAAFERSRRFRKTQFQAEKRRIAAFCAELVSEGSSIFIDCGSTPEEIAEAITDKKNIVVLTNSLPAANILSSAKDLKLIMTPGEFIPKHQNFIGQLTSDFIRKFNIDILFLGCDGLDTIHGATNPHIADSLTKRNIIKQAKKIVLGIDHTKIGVSYFMSIATLDEINLVVTDTAADPAIIEELRQAGMNIVQV